MEEQQLQALLGSLRQGQQAKQSLPGLADRRAEAAALRDRPIAEIDKSTGYMSPFAALAGVLKNQRGQREISELDPQIEQARQQVGGAESGLQEYGLKQALAKQALTAANREQDQARDQTALELTATNRGEDRATDQTRFDAGQEDKRLQREHARYVVDQQMKPKPEKFGEFKQYVNEDGDIFQVTQKGGKTFIQDEEGNPVQGTLDGMKEYEKEKGLSKKDNIFKEVKTPHIKDVVGTNKAIRTVNRINKQIENFTPEDMESLSSDPEIFTKMLTEGITPSALNTMISGKRYSPAAKEYLTSLNQFAGKIRNNLYGSALTAAEIKLSDLWLPSATGLTVEDAQARMSSILDASIEGVQALDDSYQKDFSSTLPKRYTAGDDKRAAEAAAAAAAAAAEAPAVSPERQKKIDRLAELRAKQAAAGG